MAGHSEHKTYQGQALIVLAIAIAALLFLFWGNNSSVVNIAKNTFDLTAEDLTMIPVSGIGFFLFYIVMQRVFFTPVIALIEQRESMTSGAETTAKDLERQAEDLKKSIEQKLFDARLAGAQAKSAHLNQARATAQTSTEQMQAKIAEQLKSGRNKIVSDSAELERNLTTELEALANNAVQKIIDLPIAHK